jgi:hypothetical protein
MCDIINYITNNTVSFKVYKAFDYIIEKRESEKEIE